MKPLYWAGFYTCQYLYISAGFIKWLIVSCCRRFAAGVRSVANSIWRTASSIANFVWCSMVMPACSAVQAVLSACARGVCTVAHAAFAVAVVIWTPIAALGMAVGNVLVAAVAAAYAGTMAAGKSIAVVACAVGSAVYAFSSSVWGALASLFRACL